MSALTRTCAYAWGLFLATTFASLYCYCYLQKSHSRHDQFIPSVRIGETSYRVGGGDHCVGLVTLKVTKEKKEISLSGDGAIRVALAGTTIPLTIQLRADFNALQQLGGAFLKISSQTGYALISFFNIHPIKVNIRVKNEEINRDFSTTIAGPIRARSESNGEIFIEPKIQPDFIPHIESAAQQPIMQRIRVSETQDESEQKLCANPHGAAIELDSTLHLLHSVANLLPHGGF